MHVTRAPRSIARALLALLGASTIAAAGCGTSDDDAAAGGAGGQTTTSTTTTNTPAGGAGGSASCNAEPAVACTTALADRLATSQVAASDAGFGSVFLAAAPGGCAAAAWTDGSAVHVTPLDAAGARLGDDLTTTATELRGLVAHDDGAAVLVVRGDQMALVRLSNAGPTVFENAIVGGNAHQTEGDRWIDGWPHEGRLAWSGSTYAAYFGQTGNWGAQGNHQGDHLATFDAAGAPGGQGWDWGCSHSLEVRIAHDGARFGPVCVSDCYPGKGIYFNHDESLVSDEPSGNCQGGSSASLGGLVPASDGFWLTYVSDNGRPSHDVALVHIGDDASVGAPLWLTNSDGTEEANAHLVRYGGGMLAAWSAGSETLFAVLDATGSVVDGPTAIATTLPQGSDMAAFPSGDVGWAYASPGGFTMARIARCE